MKIKNFKITNFRSLVNFEISEFDSTTIFYGVNNAGKSNILESLQLIFSRKEQFDIQNGFSSPKNFYEGVVRKNLNNFYNQDDSLEINFWVTIELDPSETKITDNILGLLPDWEKPLIFYIEGKILKNPSQYEDGLADFTTTSIKLNESQIYDPTNAEGFYFPSLVKRDKSNVSDLEASFSELTLPLNDCVLVIPHSRDMHPVDMNKTETLKDISPLNFKHFLHDMYLSEKGYKDFETIEALFASKPFSFGKISFSEINKELEIMIKENSVRLPIKHFGSGVLQILYIISLIVFYKRKIVCIEELEQNLAPEMQKQSLRKLQSMIGSFLTQIILSSHSTTFMEKRLSSAIYVIEKDNGRTQIAEKVGDQLGQKALGLIKPTLINPQSYTGNAYTDYQQEW